MLSAAKARKFPLPPFRLDPICILCGLLLLLSARAAARSGATPPPDEPPSDVVGSIEGEAIAVQGPMTVQVENGQVKTILRSGSDVRVKAGQARIKLMEGGEIVICGPAHLSVLKASGALTLALDSGTIHARINNEPALTVYTAQIQAKPIAIGSGPKEIFAGFDAPGVMCVRAKSGAIHLEQQLTGESVVLPQAGDILLANGALSGFRSGAGHCACEFQTAKAPPPPVPEASVIASAKDIKPKPVESKRAAVAPPALAEGQEPVYQVFMPPLRYDAMAKVQEEPDPQMIVLVRRVRVRPTLIFESEVTGDPVVVAVAPAPPSPPAAASSTTKDPTKPPTPSASVVDRVRLFFRRLWSGNS